MKVSEMPRMEQLVQVLKKYHKLGKVVPELRGMSEQEFEAYIRDWIAQKEKEKANPSA